MTTLTFTYECTEFYVTQNEHIKSVYCMDIALANGIAWELLNDKHDRSVMKHIQQIINHSEALRGRTYIMGSIDSIRCG